MEANIAVLIEGRKFTSVEELDQVFFSNAVWPAPLPFRPARKVRLGTMPYRWARDIFANTSYYKDLFIREGVIKPEDSPPAPRGCSIIVA